MKQCPNCQASVSDTAKFCMLCGFNIKKHEEEQTQTQQIFCPECGTKITMGTFCPECGYNVSADMSNQPMPTADAFGDDWISTIDAMTTADVEREEAAKREAEERERERIAAEEAERRAAEERERQRLAAEEAARREAARQEQIRLEALKTRRNALFAQKFQKNDGKIIFGSWQQSRANGISASGYGNGYCTVGSKKYYRSTINYKKKKLVGYADVSSTSYFEVEPIVWKILLETDDYALVVAEEVLDYRQFRESDIGNTSDYINSDLRKWLNGEFLNNAFTDQERSYIRTTEIQYNYDKIFIPSEEDYNKYSYQIRPEYSSYTGHRSTDGSYVSDYYSNSRTWWLRYSTTVSDNEPPTATYYGYGSPNVSSSKAYYCEGVVPMLYIDKTKLD